MQENLNLSHKWRLNTRDEISMWLGIYAYKYNKYLHMTRKKPNQNFIYHLMNRQNSKPLNLYLTIFSLKILLVGLPISTRNIIRLHRSWFFNAQKYFCYNIFLWNYFYNCIFLNLQFLWHSHLFHQLVVLLIYGNRNLVPRIFSADLEVLSSYNQPNLAPHQIIP